MSETPNEPVVDRTRPESVYVSWAIYPPGELIYSGKLFTIDKFYGDGRGVSIVLTPEEAREVVRRLTVGLAEHSDMGGAV